MSSHFLNNPYGGNSQRGGGPHQYAYNLRNQTVQRVPSGVCFNLSQIDAGREELEILEKGIDPLNIFPTFFNLDGGYVSNTGDTTSTSNTSNDTRCLPLLDVNIDVNVQSSIAKTKVTQTFTNMSNHVIREANYSFPLYDGSAVISFRVHVGDDKLLEGVIKPKEVAREDFKEAIAKQKVAALLEEHTPEIFETKLGNIPARSSVKVEITYVNELKADIEGEGVLVTLPTSIAPRYGASPPHMSTPSATDNNGLHIAVHVHTSESLRKLESRTHPISVEMGTTGTVGIPAAVSSFGDLASADVESDNEFDPKKAKATLSERQVTLGRDFVLLILASGPKMLASGALLEEALGVGAQSAMGLTLNPRDLFSSCVEPESFNGEIIFIADRSGSMHGSKMDTLKDALNVFLKSLTEEVHFNIYSFGSNFTSLWPQSQLYTDDNVELAVRSISAFTANMGGTEILQPIKEAVEKRIIRKNFTTQIICLTDGEVWDETMVRNFVRDTRSEFKDSVRFFALGIGNKVSHRLIEGIGTEGGGFAEVVAVDNRGRWEGRVMRLVKGALTPKSYDCEIEFHGMSTKAACFSTVGSSFMQAPYKVPALHPFSRTTVYFLFDKYYGVDLNVVTLKTSTPSGKQISVEIPVSKVTANTYTVHHLAAKAIVKDLETSRSWLHGTMKDDKVADAVAKELGERLAIDYYITSKWTSFVATEKKGKEEKITRLYKAPKSDLVLLNRRRAAPITMIRKANAPAYMEVHSDSAIFHSHSASQLLSSRESSMPQLESMSSKKGFGHTRAFQQKSSVSTQSPSSLSSLESPDAQMPCGSNSSLRGDSSDLLASLTTCFDIPRLSPSLGVVNDKPVEETLSSANGNLVEETLSGADDNLIEEKYGDANNNLVERIGFSGMGPTMTESPLASAYKKTRQRWLADTQSVKTEMIDESPQHAALSDTEALEGVIGRETRRKRLSSIQTARTKTIVESPQHATVAGTAAPEGMIDPQDPAIPNSSVFLGHPSQHMAPQLSSFQSSMITESVYLFGKNSSTDEAQPQIFFPRGTSSAMAPIPSYNEEPMATNSSYHEEPIALNLHNLIRVQSAKGSFKLPPNFIQILCSCFSADILLTLEDILSSNGEDTKAKLDDMIDILLQTLLAVMWIKLACAEDKEVWELLVSKAERWIKQTVGNKEVEERLYECARAQWVLPNSQGSYC